MKKMAILALAAFGSLAVGTTSASAFYGQCEAIHTMEIAACNGDSACGDAADNRYFECLKRQVRVDS
ncbi:hypothetical protein FPZ54_19355 [Sphingomonas suaedae]|uniref:Uncharacterized protein n=1 Tax=Sphingomonas suaedae TaxID=2599297 RepID=A0A518RKH9_9SPHN|nr:hypothetical protein [Sphingomonas suaedae]QDX27956.1 hypothetical protein FPZ54_19355 [Sphingomonas suaedae]